MLVNNKEFRMFPDRIEDAVDGINAIKEDTRSSADPDLLESLEKNLSRLAQVLRLFHHVFDHSYDERTLSEDVTPELFSWCREYDRDFMICHNVFLQYKAQIESEQRYLAEAA